MTGTGGGHIASDRDQVNEAIETASDSGTVRWADEAIDCSKDAEDIPPTIPYLINLRLCGPAVEGGESCGSVCSAVLSKRSADRRSSFLVRPTKRTVSDGGSVSEEDEVTDCSEEEEDGESAPVPEGGDLLAGPQIIRLGTDLGVELLFFTR